jgi:hypothetical protein
MDSKMNERIRKLACDAAMVEVVCSQKSVKVHYPKNFEKFAALIIRECIEQVWYTRENVIDSNISEVIKERIKEHFGVEE